MDSPDPTNRPVSKRVAIVVALIVVPVAMILGLGVGNCGRAFHRAAAPQTSP